MACGCCECALSQLQSQAVDGVEHQQMAVWLYIRQLNMTNGRWEIYKASADSWEERYQKKKMAWFSGGFKLLQKNHNSEELLDSNF